MENPETIDILGVTAEEDFEWEDNKILKYNGSDLEVVIPDRARLMGAGVFKDRDDITSVMCPSGLSMLGQYSFYNCISLSSISYSGDQQTGYARSVGQYCFYGCKSLKSINNIAVYNIGQYAFAGCEALEEINISPSTTLILDGAFQNCKSLTSITIPANVTTIGNDIFANDTSLVSVTNNSSVSVALPEIRGYYWTAQDSNTEITSIKNGTAVRQKELPTYENAPYTLSYTVNDASNKTITITGYTLKSDISEEEKKDYGDLIIPETIDSYTVTEIGHSAFLPANLFTGDIHLPDTITSIGAYAFYGCSSISGKMSLPSNLKYIGSSAFFWCYKMHWDFNIPDGVENIGAKAFYQCNDSQGELKIPDSLTYIGESAFYYCYGIKGTVYIPNNVTTIGNNAFNNCSKIMSFECEANQKPNGWGDNWDCVSPNSVQRRTVYWGVQRYDDSTEANNEFTYEIDKTNATATITGYTGNGYGSIIIPSKISGYTVTAIADSAFKDGRYFNGNISIPDTVTSIGDYAFYNCRRLTGELSLPKNLQYLGKYAFWYCEGLSGDLIIPDSITTVNEYTFQYCSGFDGYVVLSKNLNTLGKYAFMGCSGLTGDLVLPDTLESIGDYVFYKCSGLNGKIVFPKGIQTIPTGMFWQCSGFSGKLIIPESVENIEALAFYNCQSFTGELVIPSNVKSLEHDAFYGCKGFSGDIVIPEGIETIEAGVFQGCSGFEGKIVFPDSLKKIERYAFAECSNLTGELDFPDTLEYIGSDAFAKCSNITGELRLPEGITQIEVYSFYGCTNLSGKLIIPNSVTRIGECAFRDCNNIDHIECEYDSKPDTWDEGWNCKTYDYDFATGQNDRTYFDVVWGVSHSVIIKDARLNLGGVIDVIISMNNPEGILDGGYAIVDGDKYELTKTGTGVEVTYPVCAKNIHKSSSIKVYDNNDTQVSICNSDKVVYPDNVFSYSVEEYANKVINGDYDTKLKNLMKSLLVYGEYADAYFSGVSTKDDLSDAYQNNLSAYARKETGTLPEGIQYLGSSLVLEDSTTIRHYFKGDFSSINVLVSGKKADTKSVQKKGAYTYIEVNNVASPALKDAYKISISDSKSTYEIEYSALSYCNSVVNSDRSKTLTDLAKAIHFYSIAANKYFD